MRNSTPSLLSSRTMGRMTLSKEALSRVTVASVTLESASFDNVILPMVRDDNKLGVEFRILEFYQSVSTNKELRDASSVAEKEMDDFSIESSMREDVFKLVDATLKKKEKLDPESQRLLEKIHKMYVRNGLGVPAGPKRDRFKEIKKRISELQIAFQKALNEEDGGVWLTPEELDGVS